MFVLRVVVVLLLVVVVVFLGLSWSSRRHAPTLGLVDGRLLPCGSRPNCVSSEAGASRSVAPLPLPPGDAIAALVAAVERLPHARIVEVTPGYLRAEVRTALLRFVDDLELRVDQEQGLVQVRSASRVGYSDRGENRRRVEQLRRLLDQPELVDPTTDRGQP